MMLGGSAHQAGGQGPTLTGVSFPDLTVHCLRAFPSQTWKGTRHRSIAASENQVSSTLKQENILRLPRQDCTPPSQPTNAIFRRLPTPSPLSPGHFPALEDLV